MQSSKGLLVRVHLLQQEQLKQPQLLLLREELMGPVRVMRTSSSSSSNNIQAGLYQQGKQQVRE
jgi:hypothetical protein